MFLPSVTGLSIPPALINIPPEVVLLYGLIPLLFSRYFIQKRKKMLAGQEPIGQLNAMDMASFSNAVVTRLSQCGFTVVPTPNDPGPDINSIKMIRNGEMHLLFMVREDLIKSKHIQEYTNILFTEGIQRGIVISTGITPPESEICSGNMSLELIDGKTLLAFLGQPAHCLDNPAQPLDTIRSLINAQYPLCPFCQSSMAIHLGRNNGHPGKTHWKCARNPECQGAITFKLDTIQVEA